MKSDHDPYGTDEGSEGELKGLFDVTHPYPGSLEGSVCYPGCPLPLGRGHSSLIPGVLHHVAASDAME